MRWGLLYYITLVALLEEPLSSKCAHWLGSLSQQVPGSAAMETVAGGQACYADRRSRPCRNLTMRSTRRLW